MYCQILGIFDGRSPTYSRRWSTDGRYKCGLLAPRHPTEATAPALGWAARPVARPDTMMVRLVVGGVKGGGAGSADTHLERLEVVEVALEAVEHLAHRHALDSILVLDQDHTVGSDQTGFGQSL